VRPFAAMETPTTVDGDAARTSFVRFRVRLSQTLTFWNWGFVVASLIKGTYHPGSFITM
jgi:hypothetical protein